jgi:hypothetical protein
MLEFFQEHTRLIDALVVLFTGIVIAAVSSWITVQLSPRRFRSERWWERKVQAYKRIIGALHDSKAFANNHLEAVYEVRELGEETIQDLRARAKTATDEIVKAVDIGAFLLPNEALSRLKQYRNEEKKAGNLDDWHGYLEADWDAADKCLKDLIQIAKRDLGGK